MSRGRKLKKEQIGAVIKLKQSSLVEKVKICKDWIIIWFETGIIEKWTFNNKEGKFKKFPTLYRTLPSDSKEWIKKDIPILNEDPIGLDAIFQNTQGEIVDNFLVKHEDINQGGFFDKRLMAHKITLKVLSDGWIKPNFRIEILKKDWQLLKNSYKPQQKVAKSIIMAENLYKSPRRICGYAVWSHFFDLESYEEKKQPFKKCYDEPTIIMSAIERLMEKKIKITRTNLLFAIIKKSYMVKRHGPYDFKPNAYRDLFTRILKIKNPIVLDYTPDIGAKAMATILCDGIYFYKNSKVMKWADKFADFSGGKLIEDDDSKAVDVAIIGAIGTYKIPKIELISQARKRSRYTLIFCRSGKQEKEILSYAPANNIITIMCGIVPREKILVYKN